MTAVSKVPQPGNERPPDPVRADAENPPQLATGPAPARAANMALLRRQRTQRLLWRLLLFVGLPTLMAAFYYVFIASAQYQSYSVFTVHSAEARPSFGIESFMVGIGGAAARDALAVRDYVLSRDMLHRLDEEHAFISHYKQAKVDWISRLPSDASFEDAYEYFLDKIAADFDTNTGSLTLRVRAFDPEKAVELSRAILGYGEDRVNELSQRERSDRTQFAEQEVSKAEERLIKARESILTLQQKHKEINPLEAAGAALSLRSELEGQVAKARAELMELQSFMQPDAPQVLAARERVNALSAQVAQENQRLVAPTANGLNAALPDFEAAMMEKEFAQKAYEAARAALEMARADATRQHRYLAIIANPSLPDESTYPRRFKSTFTVFVISFLALGVGLLIVAAVREHSRL